MIRMRFNIDLAQVRSRLQGHVLTVQKKLAFNLLEGVVIMTPVDTGRAKGNWFVTILAPRLDYDWAKSDPTGQETINAGTAELQRLQNYGAIYLTNNLPYIVPLEKGHSRQAPAGMVRVSLDRVAAGLR
jgi:hypothetical protein